MRFGAFDFDLRRQELRRQGHLIKLPAAQLRLLNLFLERPGELITRDEITAHLWVDTGTIDVSSGINTSINRLRANLSDPQSSAEYIETVIGLGYRFVAEIAAAPSPAPALPEAPAKSEPPVEETPVPPSEVDEVSLPIAETPTAPVTRSNARSIPHRGWLAVCSLVLLVIAGGFFLLRLTRARSATAAMPVTKTASLPFHLRPVTLTAHGETISAVAVSPDGNSVAFSNRAGVSIHTFGGTDHLLPSRPFFQVSRISWFPDGKQLLLSGTDTQTRRHQVLGAILWEGYLRPFADDADLATVSPTGDSVAYTRHNNTELWVADAGGENPRKLLTDARGSFTYLIWSSTGDHLLADRHTTSPDLDSYESIDARSGAVLTHESGLAFPSGYLLEDGRLYFPISGSQNPASGKTRLMMVHTDPRTGKLLEKPQELQTFSGYGGALSASTDGKRIALALDYATVNVFVADLHLPGPTLDNIRELPHKVEESYPHAWTPDGKAVLSESSVLGTWAIFKNPLDAPESQLVAKLPTGAAMAQTSPDGRWIMFLEVSNNVAAPSGIFRVPVAGGEAAQVPVSGQIEDFLCPVSASGTCVLRETIDNTELVYHALDPVTGIGRELARTPWHPIVLGDWGLSPDGSTLSVTDHDLVHPSIHLVPLGNRNEESPSELPLVGHGALLGSNWAADGRSLFVQCRTRDGFELVNLDMVGHVKVLRKSSVPLWGIPSRDGKKIAFPDRTNSNNVWASDTTQ
ncbi:winged helix-turn-helix domain-containing protein [Granulicella tundricola]|uniref:winged helix-turn-helix domain-containing protein n=1 Tax=Granulicella tundricola TaxID=940615 RepID=UPI0001DB7711|nr:winged helix-turn-helix domain-containing protein [Granulicella tundricola]